jgi:nucleoside-diphosphate kinase
VQWSGKVVKPAKLDAVCTMASPLFQALGVIPNTCLVILGTTNPLASPPGTIRGDYAIDVGRNVCHGSDGVESAKKEIALWFKPEEIHSYEQDQKAWIYEK